MAGYLGNIPTPQATQTRDTFTATSGQTSFATSGYTVGMLDVYLNGIKLASADFTASNGSDVVLASGASADDIVEVVSFSTFETNSGVFTGDFSVDSPTFKVDSSNNRVGIGTASPHTTTEIVTTASGSVSESLQIRNNATASGTGSKIRMINSTDANSDANSVSITSNRTNGDNFMTFETEDTERMRIDASGHITMPNQSAFSVTKSAHQLNLSSGITTITFNTERFDQNADYNGLNTFTAPVTGRYQLSFNLYLDGITQASDYYQANLATSNRKYYFVFDPDFGQNNLFWNLNGSLLVEMDAGDTATIEMDLGSGVDGTNDINAVSSFHGFLAC